VLTAGGWESSGSPSRTEEFSARHVVGENMNENMIEVRAKRELGNGRWDRKLKERMVELSISDNYDDAKHEWIATGEVWWQGIGTVRPVWATTHPDSCLCGHKIVYHFEIHNTENGVRECVGSDHVNSYLIMRAIQEETGLSPDAITEEMIQEWIDVRVDSLKKDAWWFANGEDFEATFNAVKELDLRINVHQTGKHVWDDKLRIHIPETKIRKKASGLFGVPDYKMSSIVWRWNHPDNPKAQINTKGYPNENLIRDLTLFKNMIDHYSEIVRVEDERFAKMSEKRKKYEEQIAIRQKAHAEQRAIDFSLACEHYDIPTFSEDLATTTWEKRFLQDMKNRVLARKDVSDRQMTTLLRIINQQHDKPTERQVKYLRVLGYDGDVPSTKSEASRLIDELKKEVEK